MLGSKIHAKIKLKLKLRKNKKKNNKWDISAHAKGVRLGITNIWVWYITCKLK